MTIDKWSYSTFVRWAYCFIRSWNRWFYKNFFRGLQKQNKISVLLASHMEEVKRLCSSVLMMKDGLIVDRGTPENLIKIWKKKFRRSIFRNC